MVFDPDKFGDGVDQQSSQVVQFIPPEEDQPAFAKELENFQQHITRPYFSNFATLAVKTVGSVVNKKGEFSPANFRPPSPMSPSNNEVLAATDKFILASFQEQDQERTSVREAASG